MSDTLKKLDTSRISGDRLARVAGYHPQSRRGREVAGRAGKDVGANPHDTHASGAAPQRDWCDDLLETVADIAGVPVSEIHGSGASKRPRHKAVLARRALIRALHRHWSYPQIAERLDLDAEQTRRNGGGEDASADVIAQQALARWEG